jgi:hypothetical protein
LIPWRESCRDKARQPKRRREVGSWEVEKGSRPDILRGQQGIWEPDKPDWLWRQRLLKHCVPSDEEKRRRVRESVRTEEGRGWSFSDLRSHRELVWVSDLLNIFIILFQRSFIDFEWNWPEAQRRDQEMREGKEEVEDMSNNLK